MHCSELALARAVCHPDLICAQKFGQSFVHELLYRGIFYVVKLPTAEVAYGVAVSPLYQCLASLRGQNSTALQWIDELPRSAIGKVLKRELRERYEQENKETSA